jgi:hypothetical protein
MEFVERFKRSPAFSFMLGMGCLVLLGCEWSRRVLRFHGEHRAGGWDFYLLFGFFGVSAVTLTVSGFLGLVRRSGEDEE